MRSLVIFIFLYAFTSWTLTELLEKNAELRNEILPKAIKYFVQETRKY